MSVDSKSNRFDNLDGLRSIAAICIILMHVYLNGKYNINNIFIDIISRSANFVQLFFIISGFGMCCGYYEKIKNNKITLNSFYKKRYIKILPYFALLVVIDLVISKFALNSIVEGFSDITLFYAFFPNSKIQVIGVGWALGVIFAFYCLFPFIVFLLWNKRRAWIMLIIAIIINCVCTSYFTVDGSAVSCNLARWMCYFILGGILYLYKDKICRLTRLQSYIVLVIAIIATILWYVLPGSAHSGIFGTLKTLSMFGIWMVYSMCAKSYILSNPVTRFISAISFEIYLAHMMMFRIIERLHLVHLFKTDGLSYAFTCVVVLITVMIFATIAKKAIDIAILNIQKVLNSHNK
ncbi:MAG: acyltransferase family protein [Candidatus Ornithomonoglobus sp.]